MSVSVITIDVADGLTLTDYPYKLYLMYGFDVIMGSWLLIDIRHSMAEYVTIHMEELTDEETEEIGWKQYLMTLNCKEETNMTVEEEKQNDVIRY